MKPTIKQKLASLAEVQRKIAETTAKLQALKDTEETLISKVQPALEREHIALAQFASGNSEYEVRFGVVYRKSLDQQRAKILLRQSGAKIPLRDTSFFKLKVSELA